MGLADEVQSGVDGVLTPAWKVTNGTVVPESVDIVLRDGAVKLDATYLYADMADSTGLAQNYEAEAVAKVIRCYLNAATRLIRARVSWAVSQIIKPKFQAKWPDLKWTMAHGIGIDTGEAMLVRGGVHGDNDIISVGSAPNVAAKLSEVRGWSSIHASYVVYSRLNEASKFASGKDMWSRIGVTEFGNKKVTYYGTNYHWKP
jgi:class 3 adenylate cyclase